MDRAYELLMQMRMSHLQPNAATFSALMDACTRGRRIDMAFEVPAHDARHFVNRRPAT